MYHHTVSEAFLPLWTLCSASYLLLSHAVRADATPSNQSENSILVYHCMGTAQIPTGYCQASCELLLFSGQLVMTGNSALLVCCILVVPVWIYSSFASCRGSLMFLVM